MYVNHGRAFPMRSLKYKIIMDYLRKEFIESPSSDGAIPTEMELSARFGTSRFPVNQAVERLVEEGLLVRVDGIGTFIKGREPELFKGKGAGRATLTALVSQVGAVNQELLQGMQDVGLERNIVVANVLQDAGSSTYEQIAKRVKASRIEGVFLSPCFHFGEGASPSLEFAERLADKGVPVVVVDRPLPGFSGFQAVVDNIGGVAKAMRELAAMGHRRIACFGKDDYIVGRERLMGYRLGLDHSGLVHDASLEVVDRNGPDFIPQLECLISAGLDRILAAHGDCRAFMTFNITFAWHLYRILKRRGLLREDTVIAGFDAPFQAEPDFLAKYMAIKLPFRRLGQVAMGQMIRLFGGRCGSGWLELVTPEIAVPGEAARRIGCGELVLQ